MASTTYALLVGIDRYLPPVTPLRGCVADALAVRDFLEARASGDGRRLEIETLLDEEATRAAIIETLLRRRYIEREKKALLATDLGRYLIALVNDPILMSPEMTGDAMADLREKNAVLWKGIFEEDIFVVEGMQKGRHASGFDGGKFSPVMDGPTHCFHHWIASQLGK